MLIDFSCNHNAIYIPLHGCAESMPYHNMHGDEFQDRLYYLQGAAGLRIIQRVPHNPQNTTVFAEFSESTLIRRINIRLAREREILPCGIIVPKTKSVKLQTFLAHTPQWIPWANFNGRPFATTCRVKIDFVYCKVLMQVPYRDWLCLEENQYLLDEAVAVDAFNYVNEAACNLIVYLDRAPYESPVQQKIGIIAKIGERHGLPKTELHRMIDSIYEVRSTAISAHHPV